MEIPVEPIKELTNSLKLMEKIVFEKTEFLNSINRLYTESPGFQRELQIEANNEEVADFQNLKNQVSIHTNQN